MAGEKDATGALPERTLVSVRASCGEGEGCSLWETDSEGVSEDGGDKENEELRERRGEFEEDVEAQSLALLVRLGEREDLGDADGEGGTEGLLLVELDLLGLEVEEAHLLGDLDTVAERVRDGEGVLVIDIDTFAFEPEGLLL